MGGGVQAPAAQPWRVITGVVVDDSGRPVPGASVAIGREGNARLQTVTGAEGRFTISLPPGRDAVLVVRAPGFAESRQTIAETATPIQVVVHPSTITETITVTPTRGEQRAGDVPASITVLGGDLIRHAAAATADDLLRQVPTFSLFRRSSSLASHPTTQGVSLRGIGPSGVSRTLVLLDDVPLNDPFGGWVYWSRVPLESAERIEVAEGPSSSLYGNYAMGGVINIVTIRPSAPLLDLRAQYGTRRTPHVEASVGGSRGPVGAMISASGLDTNGYPPVVASQRGPVDTNAAVRYGNASARLEYDPSDRVQAFVRGGYFHERRRNGKISTIDGVEEANDTTSRSASAGLRWRPGDGSEIRVTAFGDDETFNGNFLAVPAATPPRSIGRMTLNQRVPATTFGTTTQWSRGLGSRQAISAGADWRWVKGDSIEDGLDPVRGEEVTLHRVSGGRQQSAGLFAQDVFSPTSAFVLTLSARIDRWRNYAGHNLETTVPAGVPTDANVSSLPARTDIVASPRAAALYKVSGRVNAWASAGGGFRAPTLNELYRQFRVGSTLTLPNTALGPERLRGYEVGVTATPASAAVLRATFFDNRLSDPVSNVTIGTSNTSVTQQRQNLGRTRVRGLQADVEYRAGRAWMLSAAYVRTDARVTRNAAAPELVGNVLAQVPANRASLRATYTHARGASIGASLLYAGAQFDDDRNLAARRLPSYAVVDLSASAPIRRGVELFATAQNLFDREYLTGTLPSTAGSPRLISGGVRIRLDGR